ncbi:MAG: helix-turn-helix domain-containing protein [Clostridiales bacterium]|nr:helix-turn-helix domain-containing protein [Clostridiales bacterium]
MAVFRIDKTKNYTVMANYHLRDTSLSLKAKGLLSLMLSLPEGWDYTTKGLACICKDGVDSICSTVKELENAGYVQRRRLRNELGHLTEVEYTILEKPVRLESSENPPKAGKAPKRENPVLERPVLGNPVLDIPEQAIPEQEEPEQENPAQLNIQESITEKSNNDLSSKDSFFPSADVVPLTDGKKEREKIRAQIEYDIMRERYGREQIDELVEIMLEVSMNRSPTIHIGREAEYATAYVQDRFSKINAMHIERVCDGIQDNRTQVRNTKAYLLAALFNAVSTLDSYYTMQANYDYGSSY